MIRTNPHVNPARRLFPICVSPLSFTHLRFGIVNPYGTWCVSTSRSPRPFSHRQFDPCNPHVESACLLSEVLGRCHIGILGFTTLTQLVLVDLRRSRTIRSSPLRPPLSTLVAGLSPDGSIWNSLGVPIWSLFPSRPFPLPGRPLSPPRLRLGTCPRPGDVWPIAVGPTCCLCFACSYAGDGMYYTSPASPIF